MKQLFEDTSALLPRAAEVLWVRNLTSCEKHFGLRLEDGSSLGHQPGQFVMVSIFGMGEAPISICSEPRDGEFELCVRAVGNLTRALHLFKPGDRIGIRGPYGTHYPTEEAKGKDVLCVAGGLGLAPLRSFIRYCLDHRDDYRNFTVFFGARSPEDRLFSDELDAWTKDPRVDFFETVDSCTPEHCWTGRTGVITTLFPLIHPEPKQTCMVVVGPPIMYRFVLAEAMRQGIPDTQVFMSLERRMRCGVGRCGHCQMGGIYVCQSGAVFRYSDVRHVEEAWL